MSFAEVYHHRFKYFLSPQLDLYRNISSWIDRQDSKQFSLDYGCGNGVGSVALWRPDRTVYGVDNDGEVVDLCRELFGNVVAFHTADWTKSSVIDGKFFTFQKIVCVEVLEHVERPEEVLLSFVERLDMNRGHVVISSLNHNSQYRKNSAHVGRWTVGSFRELLKNFFLSVKITDYTLTGELDDSSTRTPMVAICTSEKKL